MTLKEMVERNNEFRKKLTLDNKMIYDDVLLYIRFSPINQRDGEALLLEILDHLLILQEKGESAEKLFGSDPKAYCDELIGELTKQGGKTLFSHFVFAGIFGLSGLFACNAFFGFIGYLFPVFQSSISLGEIIWVFAAGYLAVCFIFWLMKQTLLFKSRTWQRAGLIFATVFFCRVWFRFFSAAHSGN